MAESNGAYATSRTDSASLPITVTEHSRPGFTRNGLCEIWPWNCPNKATLMVYAEECECSPCNYWAEDDECLGHPVCDEHGAILRIKKLPQHPRSPDTSVPFIVARIHTLEASCPT